MIPSSCFLFALFLSPDGPFFQTHSATAVVFWTNAAGNGRSHDTKPYYSWPLRWRPDRSPIWSHPPYCGSFRGSIWSHGNGRRFCRPFCWRRCQDGSPPCRFWCNITQGGGWRWICPYGKQNETGNFSSKIPFFSSGDLTSVSLHPMWLWFGKNAHHEQKATLSAAFHKHEKIMRIILFYLFFFLQQALFCRLLFSFFFWSRVLCFSAFS